MNVDRIGQAREYERTARFLRENRRKVQTNGVVAWLPTDTFEGAARLLEHHARLLRRAQTAEEQS